MDFSLLDTFITVVHAGSIRKTSDLMNTSASGLYRRLDQLEKETGIILFESNKSSLTPAGKVFYQKICTLKGMFDHACGDALIVQNTVNDGPAGTSDQKSSEYKTVPENHTRYDFHIKGTDISIGR